MKYFIDTSAWVDYLEGSLIGAKVREIILGNNELLTIPLVLAEVVSKVERARGNIIIAYETIRKNARVIENDESDAFEAGKLHAEMKKKLSSFSLADAFIIISAKKTDSTIVTKDSHLSSFKKVLFL